MATKRSYERVRITKDLDMSIKVLGEAVREPVSKVLDFSVGGMKIVSSKLFAVDNDVDLMLVLPRRKVKFVARIKRAEEQEKEYVMGLQFVTISESNLEELYNLFAS